MGREVPVVRVGTVVRMAGEVPLADEEHEVHLAHGERMEHEVPEETWAGVERKVQKVFVGSLERGVPLVQMADVEP